MSTNSRDLFDVDLDVALGDLIDRHMLTELCESFLPLIGAPIRVFDAQDQQLAAAAPEEPHAACQDVLRFESGLKACSKLKRTVRTARLEGEHKLEGFSCFCGLRYTVVPIKFQGRVMGKLSVGPYLVTGTNLDRGALASAVPQTVAVDLEAILSVSASQAQSMVERLVLVMTSSIDLILFSAQKAHAMTQAHLASLKESYKELTAKNRELSEKNERLGELEKLKSSFLATMSHELRTPLTSIIGYSDALYDGIAGSLGKEQLEFIATIRTKGEELLRLITSILDFSRIDAGR
ncbi:MAG: PocR ligand-binding domain-containing protein, partial [Myxococcota bacterium]|nr:PocR ligand-binding domain-containing protein [Myxococcota bacterium]